MLLKIFLLNVHDRFKKIFLSRFVRDCPASSITHDYPSFSIRKIHILYFKVDLSLLAMCEIKSKILDISDLLTLCSIRLCSIKFSLLYLQ